MVSPGDGGREGGVGGGEVGLGQEEGVREEERMAERERERDRWLREMYREEESVGWLVDYNRSCSVLEYDAAMALPLLRQVRRYVWGVAVVAGGGQGGEWGRFRGANSRRGVEHRLTSLLALVCVWLCTLLLTMTRSYVSIL